MFIFAQVFGLIALTTVIASYFSKNKKYFFVYQIVANFFYGLSFLMLNLYVASISIFICLIRCIVFYIYEKKNKNIPQYIMLSFAISYIIVFISLFNNWTDVFPVITSIIFTYAFSIKNMQTLRFFSILPNIIMCIYNFCFFNFASGCLDMFEIIAIIVSIILFYKINNKTKKTIK